MLLSQESLAGVLMVLVGRMVAAVDFPINYGLLPSSRVSLISILQGCQDVGFSVTFPSYQMVQLLPLGIFIPWCFPSSPYYMQHLLGLCYVYGAVSSPGRSHALGRLMQWNTALALIRV